MRSLHMCALTLSGYCHARYYINRGSVMNMPKGPHKEGIGGIMHLVAQREERGTICVILNA